MTSKYRIMVLMAGVFTAISGCGKSQDQTEIMSALEQDRYRALLQSVSTERDSSHAEQWTYRTDIFLLLPGEASPKQLTNDRLRESRPSWMGDRLLYGAVNAFEDFPETHIFLLDPATGQREELLVDDWLDYSPWYSQGADRFLFYSNRNGDLALFTAAPDGSDIQMLELPLETGEKETYAHVWSDDGTKIAFMHQIGRDKRNNTRYGVSYFDLSTKTVKRVSQNPSSWGIFSPSNQTSALYPHWNGDSSKLLYTRITQLGEKTEVEIVDYDTISDDYNRTTLMTSETQLAPSRVLELNSATMAIPSGQLPSKANYIVSKINPRVGPMQSLYFVEQTGELSAVPMTFGEETARHARSQFAPSTGPEDQIAYVSGWQTGKFNAVSLYRKHKAMLQVWW